MSGTRLQVGEPAPWFEARTPSNPRFYFDTAAGRHVVLCFFGSAAERVSREVLARFLARPAHFKDREHAFFGVSIDPEDERAGRIQEVLPDLRLFWDFDRNISRLYGSVAGAPGGGEPTAAVTIRRFSVVLDERLRVVAVVPFGDRPETHVARVLEILAELPRILPTRLADVPAPVLIVPRLFEPALCRDLIRYYEERGGQESGFMRDLDGKTVAVYDHAHKRRRDEEIADEPLRKACMVRIHDRLVPEIARVFQFKATRIERYIVACYDAETSGHFRAHRDNTTRGTAHRRFAVSLNLNTGEYEGGLLGFPEFGRQLYEPPAGGAIVFSCSLLHEATPVTRGKRYAFLPFLYDEEAARIREQNLAHLGTGPVPPARAKDPQ